MVQGAKVALVTGASSGFGMRTALMLGGKGWTVYAGFRDLSRSGELMQEAAAAGLEARIRPIRMDVTDEEQIREAVRVVAEEAGRLDALVNNAGFAAGGFVEDIPLSVWREQFETNLFGVVAVTRECLPLMRQTGGGRIVMVGSVSGRIGFPGMAPYAASKHALEGLAESLRLELAGFGLWVSVIEPGSYKTSIWRKSLDSLPPVKPDSPYAALYAKLLPIIQRTAAGGGDPDQVAAAIFRALSDAKPKLRYLPGSGEKRMLAAKHILPWNMIENATLKVLGTKR
ncbi:SDR family oxidoreductase [Cohnella pontilimi]|uniref:SDR family oxidoreductase n=1 Tax=Cohnella pontilimi TaxID=2564100 RepID=A0A4U0FCM9_9BACL|nr:SDR family oxidoreductase [Cohnella pontilimi]TJY42438.1 SDR family oxidoreductase [Cohnella pontilimi]